MRKSKFTAEQIDHPGDQEIDENNNAAGLGCAAVGKWKKVKVTIFYDEHEIEAWSWEFVPTKTCEECCQAKLEAGWLDSTE